jgi:DNA-binding SARP family transcriptional activator/ABC-type branched-subunit amino acid transport system substrate-binding protein/outer membrane protein assembly factor BamB
VVSVERLIDGLWGDDPPETAVTALHVHVSQLRKLLEPDRLSGEPPTVVVTTPPGYALEVEDCALDLEEFLGLTKRARDALGHGDPRTASDALREGLALWRGTPLADAGTSSILVGERGRLEELRFAALEDRIDADLALGLHRELVPELEALVRQHPLRERPTGQLILALYRSGRQTDALAAYRAARRALVAEAGVEPSSALRELEGAVLRQDPSLDLPVPERQSADERLASRAGTRALRRRGPLVAATVAAALVAVAIAAATSSLFGGDGPRQVPPNSLALVAGRDPHVQRSAPVGAHPTSIAADTNRIWVLNADDQTITRFDRRSGTTRTFAIGRTPTDLVAGDGPVWVTVDRGTRLARVDPETGSIDREVVLSPAPTPEGGATTSAGTTIALGGGTIWAVAPDGRLVHVDARTGRKLGELDVDATNVTVDGDRVWVVARGNRVRLLGARTASVRRGIHVPATGLTAATAGAGSLWVSDPLDGVIWRIDDHGERLVMRTVPVAFGVAGIAYGNHRIWAANAEDSTLLAIDPEMNAVVSTVATGNPPQNLTVDGDAVWVTVGGTPSASPRWAVAQPPCGNVVYPGHGSPDRLIAVDVPLRGASRANALSLVQGVDTMLREHGFRAGRFTVGYQFCDDATAQAAGWEVEKCASNARAYADTARVIGVIGAYNSGCSSIEIPVAGQGGLAMLSASNSAPELTIRSPRSPRSELERLYPAGSRTYTRVYTPDDLQAAAAAELVRRSGARRVAVVEERMDGTYAGEVADAFVHAARRLALTVVARPRWQPGTNDRSIAAAVAATRPGAVMLAASPTPDTGSLLRRLREVLPAGVPILAPESFSRVSATRRVAGEAADGLLVTVSGIPVDRLGTRGKRFAAELRRARPGGVPTDVFWGLYGAQASEVLLDAIARSDGRRSSVVAGLRSTRLPAGVAGPVRFRADGDLVGAPVTVLRIGERGPGMDSRSDDFADGATVVAVIRPNAALVR